jgi:hypothetical protein
MLGLLRKAFKYFRDFTPLSLVDKNNQLLYNSCVKSQAMFVLTLLSLKPAATLAAYTALPADTAPNAATANLAIQAETVISAEKAKPATAVTNIGAASQKEPTLQATGNVPSQSTSDSKE